MEGAGPLSEGDEVEVVVVSVRGDKVSLSQRSAAEIAQVGLAGLQVLALQPGQRATAHWAWLPSRERPLLMRRWPPPPLLRRRRSCPPLAWQ